MKTPFGRMIFPRKALFSICEEMRRMKPDASAPLPFRAGFRPMRDAEKNPHNNQKSNHEPCNGVQREHNKKLNNGLPILHKVPPKRDYGRYFCIMAEKGGTSHGGLTEKLSPFFHAKKQEVNAYGR